MGGRTDRQSTESMLSFAPHEERRSLSVYLKADDVLHTGSSSHEVFTAETNTIEEERPDVADDRAILSNVARGSKRENTDGHHSGILDQAPTTSKAATIRLQSRRGRTEFDIC
jgi:hypothetical protein